MEWTRIEVRVRPEHADASGVAARADLALAGLCATDVRVTQVYFIAGLSNPARFARQVLIDPVLEEPAEGRGKGIAVSVGKRSGVMDPVQASILRAARALGESPTRAATAKTYWIQADAGADAGADAVAAVGRSLANEVIEEIVLGEAPEPRDLPGAGVAGPLGTVTLEGISDDALLAVSRRYVLALQIEEMHRIRDHFAALGRAPRLGELETIAQTW